MNRTEVDAVLADPVAQALFESHGVTRLAYNAGDGSPRVVPIGYLWNGSEFVMGTVPNAPKVEALTRDPRVALTIDTDDFPPKVLLVRGTATLEPVDGVVEEFLEMGRRNIPDEQYDGWVASVRRLYTRMVRIAVEPTWAKILDFETRLPSAVADLVQELG